MKPNANTEPTLQPLSSQAPPPSATSYAPSVPISVYRELAAELQSTKALVDSLKLQNQQLVQQNQHLRSEVHRFVYASVQLGKSIGLGQVTADLSGEHEEASRVPEPVPIKPASVAAPSFVPKPLERPKPVSPASVMPVLPSTPLPGPDVDQPGIVDRLFTEKPEEPRRLDLSAASLSDMGGLWLAVSILLIVVTAFGAGFLIMRPLLSDH